MKKTLLILFAFATFWACQETPSDSGARVVEDFNFGWKFCLGDCPEFEFTSEEIAVYEAEQDSLWAIQRLILIEKQKKQIEQRRKSMRNAGGNSPFARQMTVREPSRPRNAHPSHFTESALASWAAPDFDDSGWRALHLPHD